MLSLAAATLLDVSPDEAIVAAAGAGFDAVGLRFSQAPSATRLLALSAHAADAGVGVLDVEVIRLRPGVSPREQFWTVDAAAALGATYALTVSDDDDRGATLAGLAQLAAHAKPSGVRIGLEFMRFTAIRRLEDALSYAAELHAGGLDNVDVVVDALHLSRSGGNVADLAHPLHAHIGYAQICDAPAAVPESDEEAIFEARHNRLLPGEGELPVAQLVAALAGLPVSVEVQSDPLAAACGARQRAERAMRAAKIVLCGGTTHAEGA